LGTGIYSRLPQGSLASLTHLIKNAIDRIEPSTEAFGTLPADTSVAASPAALTQKPSAVKPYKFEALTFFPFSTRRCFSIAKSPFWAALKRLGVGAN